MKKLNFSLSVSNSWQFISTTIIILSCIGLLLLTQLNTLLPGYSDAEKAYVTSTATPQIIIDNPAYLPHKLVSFAFHYPTSDNHLSARLASVSIGALVVLLFYYASAKWYSRRTAFLATVLLATSAWFLHIARVGLPDITYPAAILALAITAYKLQVTKQPVLLWSFAILLVGFVWYIPGMFWLVIIGLALQYKRLHASKLHIPKKQLPLLLIPAVLTLGLLMLLVLQNPDTLKTVLGVPAPLPTVIDFVKHILYTPFMLFFRAPLDADFRLGHLPSLDVITAIFALLGAYYYVYYRKSLRTRLLILAGLLGIILSAIHTYASQAALLPIAFILIAAGISVLTNQWLAVFPRNPVAKSFGVIVVSIVVAASCAYSLRSYFIAWPSAPATRDVYHHVL
jgi:Dolichyl-phosphate-mannose-protein mannosyltransferase